MAVTIPRTALYALRVLQALFALILIGVTAYMVHTYRTYSLLETPPLISLPLSTSIFALLFAIAGLFIQPLVSAALDFCMFVLYLASAILLRHNYHTHNVHNPLWNALVAIRAGAGEDPRRSRHGGLVKMLAAGVVLQIFLFFVTMIIAALIARRERAQGVRVSGPRHGV
ncbi:hypothetical protein EDC01DRAFT_665420 [Geopyxis carbonaria]|nr:hypothetical protein EDC01DRAFT_665420 [Geopyxis carbonaria]